MSFVNGKRTVYDLEVRLASKADAAEIGTQFIAQLRKYIGEDEEFCDVGIFYHGKRVRIIEFEGSMVHVNVFRVGDSYKMQLLGAESDGC